MFEAKVNPSIMESSQQSASYAEVVSSESIDDLKEEMQFRWARNFIDDGGPVAGLISSPGWECEDTIHK